MAGDIENSKSSQESESQRDREKIEMENRNAEPVGATEEPSRDARRWAMFCHLAALAGFLPVTFVAGAVIGPLVVWQIKKDQFPFVDEHGKEAVNFQISMLIYGVVAAILLCACVGIVLLPAVIIVDLVFLLIAAVKANEGKHYRYPLTIRFIK